MDMLNPVEIVCYSWNEQFAVDSEGNKWEFDTLYDHEYDVIVTSEANPAEYEDIGFILIRCNNDWTIIDTSMFKPVNYNG